MKNIKEQIENLLNLYKSGDLVKAEQITKKLISKNKDIVFLYNLLGLILAGQKKTNEAIEQYEKGLKVDPKFSIIYNNLALIFFSQKSEESIKKAIEYYKKSIFLDTKIPEPHNNLGNLYNSIGNYDEAINCYIKALSINSNFSFAHYNLGSVYITLGKFNEAKEHLRTTVKIDRNFTQAHRLLSRIINYTKAENHLVELLELYRNINNEDKKIDLCFALGKAHEDMNDFTKSFKYYKEANYLSKKKNNFILSLEKEKFKNIKNIFNKKLYKKSLKKGYIKFSPIFIVGMPRSGTTLVEQILSTHDNVFGCDEIEFIPNLIKKYYGKSYSEFEFNKLYNFDNKIFEKIGEEYYEMVKKISNNSKRITDKLPINFLSIGFINLILPNSKIIHCSRDSKDNIISIFKNYFPDGKINYSSNLNNIIEYYNCYKNIMKYWNTLLPNYIYNIKYEKLVSKTSNETKNLLKFCDLGWQDKCLKFYKNQRPIKTASDVQVRNKVYTTSIGSWKKYKNEVSEVFKKIKN